MKKITILLVVYLFLFINHSYTQTFTNYTVENTTGGLVSNSVNTIAIDSEGNKWFGTNDGLSMFDGTNWINYLSGNHVYKIVIDSEGNKWCGTNAILKFDDTNWTIYMELPLGNQRIPDITIDEKDNKWFVYFRSKGMTAYGYGVLNDTALTYYNIYYYGNAIAIDNVGNIWIGTSGGVLKLVDTTWTTYTTADGLASNEVSAIDIDVEGNKWFGTCGGVSKFDDTTWTTYDTLDGLADNHVAAIAIDAEGNKWFGTGGGVSKFDDFNWTTYTTSDGLVNNYVQAIAVDAENNIWIGTEGGVSKLSAEVTGKVINVPAGQPTIQAGIDAATEGDTVLVGEGTYFENINFMGKAITVASRFILDGDTSHISKTIIDGSKSTNPDTASVVTMWSGEDTTSVLLGFTIKGGTGTEYTFDNEWWERGGGGVFINGSGSKIIHNIIEGNHVEKLGSLENHVGGGIFALVYNNHTVVIRDNIIRRNEVTGQNALGGGLAPICGRIICENNEIIDNIATGTHWSLGGGIYGLFTDGFEGLTMIKGVIKEAIIRNNLISSNYSTTGDNGGGGGYYQTEGYYQDKGDGEECIQFYNNIICDNHTNGGGGGLFLYIDAQGRFFNNTIINNISEYDGNCVWISLTQGVAFYNNIVFSSENNNGKNFFIQESYKLLIFNNILMQSVEGKGDVTAFNNLYAEPVFQSGTYEPAEGSPGIGRAVDSLLVEGTWYYAPLIDFEGNVRPDPADKYLDMGALESTYLRPLLDNADLIYIGYSNLELIPAFNRDTLHYEVHLPSYVTVPPTLNVIPADYMAEVDIDHATDLQENSTTTITVTAENGTTQKEYTVFFRYKSNNALLSSLSTNFGELSPEFNSETKEYDVTVNDTCPGIGIPEVTYTTCDPRATAKIITDALNICDGKHNKTVIRVTAENGTTTGTYKITFFPINIHDGIENTNTNNLRLYPNPVVDIVKIEHSLPMTEVAVSNILGQKILEHRLNSGTTCELSLAGLRKGMYFIRVKDESGQVYTGKVIKD